MRRYTTEAPLAASVFACAVKVAVNALYNQHCWNMGWGGLTTLICAGSIWKGNGTAIWIAALTGGMADVGYFVYMDLGGHVNFMPDALMTYVSSSAIALSGWVWFGTKSEI